MKYTDNELTSKILSMPGEVKNIYDLQFKLGEQFVNNHIKIYKDDIYISKVFYNEIRNEIEFTSGSKNIRSSRLNNAIQLKNMKITVYLRERNGIHSSFQHCFLICGSSGDYGYNGMQSYQRTRLGVKIKRQVNKHMVDLYLKSNTYTLEKIKRFLVN